MSTNQLWFVRHEGKILGQFPIKEIVYDISMGHIALSDEISPDQVNWLPLERFSGLAAEHPPEEADSALDEDQIKWREERVKAAARWETPVERPVLHQPAHPVLKGMTALTAALALAGLAAFVAWQWQVPAITPTQTITPPIPVCDAAPAPKVNWQGCDKSGIWLAQSNLSDANLSLAKFNSTDLSGSQLPSANLSQADLSYATLNKANMVRVNLEGANLNFAELREADLSHANLRGASLADAALDGARLDYATWTDGHSCAADSVGQCR